jgi:hypothetical protein
MRVFKFSLLAAVLLVSVVSALPLAAGDFIRPPRGSALRAALLDVARPTFVFETSGPIEFVVAKLNVLDGWAFGAVTLQRPGGGKIDWSRTKYREDHEAGMFDPGQSFFLLRGGDAGWSVVEHAVGPTDVAWDWWRQQHRIPRSLFED